MRSNSIFSGQKQEKKLEEQELDQLKQHFYQTATEEVKQYFNVNLGKLKNELINSNVTESDALEILHKALQEGIREAEKIAQQNYERLLKEKHITQPPLA